MVRSITPLENISECRISLKDSKTDFRKVVADDGELLLKTKGTSYGFRYEETKKGNPKYTLPLCVPEEFADVMYEVARKLGDVEYAPVYEMEEVFLVYVRVPMNAGGLVFAYIHDKHRKAVKPSDKTGCMMNVKAIIKVDSLRVGGDNPKIMLSLVQAEVEDSELVHEDLLG